MERLAERRDTDAPVARGRLSLRFAKHLKMNMFFCVVAVARRMLFAPLGSTVLRLGSTALLIYAVGCIIPAPLEAETTPPPDTPIVVSGDPDFGFPITFGGAWNLSVTISYDTVDAPLYARLYHRNTMGYYPLDKQVVQGTGMKLRSVIFNSVNWCDLLNPQGTSPGPKLIYAFVKDSDFGLDETDPRDFRGHYSSQYWTVNCQ